MNQKITYFLLLAIFTHQPNVHGTGSKNQTEIPFTKIVPYLIEGACLAGGLTALLIGYFGKKENMQKLELLYHIENYCKENNIETTTLVDNQIFSFAETLKKQNILIEIIKQQETKISLKNDLSWNKGLLFVGGTILTISIIALVITTAIHLYSKDKQEEITTNHKTNDDANNDNTQTQDNDELEQERQKVLQQITQRNEIITQLEEKMTLIPQQIESVKQLWGAIQNRLHNYKNPAAIKLSAPRLYEIFTEEVEKTQPNLNKETQDLINTHLFEKITWILEQGNQPHQFFNDKVVDVSVNELGRINAILTNEYAELPTQIRNLKTEVNFLHIKFCVLQQNTLGD